MTNTTVKATTLFLSLVLSAIAVSPVLAETAYQRWLRMAETARKRGNYDTALTNYQRAADVSPNGPNDSDINAAINRVLEERLQSVERIAPNYGRFVREADRAFFEGEYDTAITNYRRALNERRGDRYATARIRQAECIKKTRPATGAQYRTFGCPRF